MKLLDEDELERSAVVANCRMNRERNLVGSNGYSKEVGFNPLDFLRDRLVADRPASWLDLCCGSGRALIQAVRICHEEGLASKVEVMGVDLIGLFDRHDPGQPYPRFVEASLRSWRPDRRFDLITCVHGLHYVGDKLGLIHRATSWLSDCGMFVANLDPANLKWADGQSAGRRIISALRRSGLEYEPRQRRLRCRGTTSLVLPFPYLGADDRAGPNYTGQPAVDSYYAVDSRSVRPPMGRVE